MSKPTSFKHSLDELEKIVEWFESGDIDLDKALEKFERGMELATSLKQQLEQMENKVVQIQAKFGEGDTETKKAAPPEDTDGQAEPETADSDSLF